MNDKNIIQMMKIISPVVRTVGRGDEMSTENVSRRVIIAPAVLAVCCSR